MPRDNANVVEDEDIEESSESEDDAPSTSSRKKAGRSENTIISFRKYFCNNSESVRFLLCIIVFVSSTFVLLRC